MVVDLPEPLGPITASDEAFGISIVTPVSATASPYLTSRSRVEIADCTAPGYEECDSKPILVLSCRRRRSDVA